MNFFINSAYAQTAEGAPGGMDFTGILFMGGFALIFYFMIWRPQSKRSKEQKSLIESIAKGDEVMTTGGLLGKITKVDENYIALNISDNVEIKMQKTSVAAVLPKGTIKSI